MPHHVSVIKSGFKPTPIVEYATPLPTAVPFTRLLIDPALGHIPAPEDFEPLHFGGFSGGEARKPRSRRARNSPLPAVGLEHLSEPGLSGIAAGPMLLDLGARLRPASVLIDVVGTDGMEPFPPRRIIPNLVGMPKKMPSPDTRADRSYSFKLKEPRDWSDGDVIQWMLDTSRRLGIPCEDVSVLQFAGIPGKTLLGYSEKHWTAKDPVHGAAFYREFQSLITGGSAGNRALEECMRGLREEEAELQLPSTSYSSRLLSPAPSFAVQQHQQRLSPMTSTINSCAIGPGSRDAGNSQESYHETSAVHGVNDRITKNKNNKPRKQPNKGVKLWEFVRDALKNPATCPSIVKWENADDGVFRIVKSGQLARLWGERKHNPGMTYEKLSRALRNYYEQQILQQLPQKSPYPKKLVYKFGPGATGWEDCRTF